MIKILKFNVFCLYGGRECDFPIKFFALNWSVHLTSDFCPGVLGFFCSKVYAYLLVSSVFIICWLWGVYFFFFIVGFPRIRYIMYQKGVV